MQVCKNCVLENDSLKNIFFNENGICNYCLEYKKRLYVDSKWKNSKLLDSLINDIKKSKNGKYDCVIGVSGGIDSSYTIIQAKELGLSPLAVHLDNGWNTELAVHNIEKLLNKLEIDLITHVLEWEEFKDLQLSFFKASVINIEIPTDHAINALLYRIASKKNIKYILSGSNVLTEAIMPEEFGGYDSYDWKHIKSIHKIFGTKKLTNYPYLSPFHWIYFLLFKRIKFVPFLNYLDYNKNKASEILINNFGWKPYSQKHYESFFTKFFQSHILPNKFNIEKRKAHYSCLVNAGQMSRDDALHKVQLPLYEPNDLKIDIQYFIKKMEITTDEFHKIMNEAPVSHLDYPNNSKNFKRFEKIIQYLKKITTLRG